MAFMKSNTVLFLTDSLGLPRERKNDLVCWESTYISLIRQRRTDIDIVHVGIPAAPILELVRVAEYYRSAKVGAIVLQSGIVDCAPRAISRFEFEVLRRMRLLRFVKPAKGFLRKHRKICYTKPEKFGSGLEDLMRAFPLAPVIACGILPARLEYERKVPGITRRIAQFNEILSQHTILIENSDFPDAGIASDHHHLTAFGNQVLAERILLKLEECLPRQCNKAD